MYLVERSYKSRIVYPRVAFITVFALHPEAVIWGQPLYKLRLLSGKLWYILWEIHATSHITQHVMCFIFYVLRVITYCYPTYSMASRNKIDEHIKSSCYFLWVFETRIAITMTTMNQYYDCEEDITMFDIIKKSLSSTSYYY